jgi:hypothetical protein
MQTQQEPHRLLLHNCDTQFVFLHTVTLQELRAHHGIDAPAAVRQKLRDDNEAGAPSAYDSQGNSIEY